MRTAYALFLALAGGCGDPAGPMGGTLDAVDYAPEPGRWLQFGPQEDPAAGPYLMIEVGEATWELRVGPDWGNATASEDLPFSAEEGLWLGGELLLPAELAEGEAQDGVELLSLGDEEVYYGTFARSARTLVPAGRFAGEQVFAPAMGPIALTLDAQAWELVYYL